MSDEVRLRADRAEGHRRFSDLAPLERADEPCVVLVAARVGATRLIDNWILARP